MIQVRSDEVVSDGVDGLTSPGPPRGWTRRRTAYEIIEYVMTRVYAGTLREGDRIDIDSIASDLGVSRSPVREAVQELQRDGFVVDPFHRSAYLAPFNAELLEDTFDLYGLLWSRATAVVARKVEDLPEVAEMRQLVETLNSVKLPEDIDATTYQYRRRIAHHGGTQRLRALLRSFGTFVPASYRRSVPELSRSQVKGISEEFKAIARGDAEEASARTHALYLRQASIVVADLRAKGIID